MDEEQIRVEMIAELRQQSRALSALLFDRNDDGSFKTDHWVKAVEADAVESTDATRMDEITLLVLLTARISFLMSASDKEHDYFGADPAMILGHIAGTMMSAEVAIINQAFLRMAEGARNN